MVSNDIIANMESTELKKMQQTQSLNLRLKPEILLKLQNEAERSGNSVQSIIKICIAEHYLEQEPVLIQGS